MKKYKIIALVGKAGAGKDTILKQVIKEAPNELNKIVAHTSRPKREHEEEGVDYHFIDIETFEDLMFSDKMLETTCFNGWVYGTCIDALSEDKINIGVFSPRAVDCISASDKCQVIIYYIDVPDKDRLLRQLNRETSPDVHEIIRRFEADEEDFLDFFEEVYYHELPNRTLQDLNYSVGAILGDARTLAKNLKNE